MPLPTLPRQFKTFVKKKKKKINTKREKKVACAPDFGGLLGFNLVSLKG